MANGVRFAVGIQRLVPMLGYHHILMILIAVAIILLCKPSCHALLQASQLTLHSITLSRLFLQLAAHPEYLPHRLLLHLLHTDIQRRTSRPRRHRRNCQHRRQKHPRSTRRLLRTVHSPRRRIVPVFEQCDVVSGTSQHRPGSVKLDLDRRDIQRFSRLPIPNVSALTQLTLLRLDQHTNSPATASSPSS